MSIWLLLSVLSCSSSIECVDHAGCPDGNACIAEVCTPVQCLSSTECALREFCDGQYNCAPGCEKDTDCIAGEVCNVEANSCEAYGCRDTQLDCYYNEFCNTRNGQCELSDEAHCKPCTGLSTSECGDGGDCWSFVDAKGNTDGTYCLVECESDADCPRGYSCYDVSGQGHVRCGGSCSLYEEFGYLPW